MNIYMYLMEFECCDCGATLLLERDREPEICPYCQGDIDYSPGKIEVIERYTPRKYKTKE
jgi:hypothetical protein